MIKKSLYFSIALSILIFFLQPAVFATENNTIRPETSVIWTDFVGEIMPCNGVMIMQKTVGKMRYQFGVMDAEGNILVPPVYQGGLYYKYHIVTDVELWDGNENWFVGEKGVLVPKGEYELSIKQETLKPVMQNYKYGYVDSSGKLVIDYQFDYVGEFNESYAVIKQDDKWGLIDRNGTILYTGDYTCIGAVSQGLSLACGQNEKWGFLNTNGVVVVPFIYDRADYFSDGLAAVCINGKWGYIDRTGAQVIPCMYDWAGAFNDGLAAVGKLENGFIKRLGILKNPLNAYSISSWATDEINLAKTLGLITDRTDSYYTYEITRLQFAELVVNYLEKMTGKTIETDGADVFTDTHDDAAKKAAAAGIVKGTGNDTFSPNMLITREQMATMLFRAMCCTMTEGEKKTKIPAPVELSRYTDGSEVAEWADDAMSVMLASNIIKGLSETKISPKTNTTIEQAILMVLRTYQLSTK